MRLRVNETHAFQLRKGLLLFILVNVSPPVLCVNVCVFVCVGGEREHCCSCDQHAQWHVLEPGMLGKKNKLKNPLHLTQLPLSLLLSAIFSSSHSSLFASWAALICLYIINIKLIWWYWSLSNRRCSLILIFFLKHFWIYHLWLTAFYLSLNKCFIKGCTYWLLPLLINQQIILITSSRCFILRI